MSVSVSVTVDQFFVSVKQKARNQENPVYKYVVFKKQNHFNQRKRVWASFVKFCRGLSLDFRNRIRKFFELFIIQYLKFKAKTKFRLDYSIKDDLLARRFWNLSLGSFFGALLMALAQQSLAKKFDTNDKIFFKTVFHIFSI